MRSDIKYQNEIETEIMKNDSLELTIFKIV